jgi:hypothetical protein
MTAAGVHKLHLEYMLLAVDPKEVSPKEARQLLRIARRLTKTLEGFAA